MSKETFINQSNNTLLDKKLKLTEAYLKIQENAEKKYGKNTVIFIEQGTFFEIYEFNGLGKATEMSKELNVQLTKKNKNFPEVSITNPMMSGVPVGNLDRHLDRLINTNKWTIIVIKQNEYFDNNKKIITRYVDNIISQGVNIDYNTTDNYNFVASLNVDKINDIYYCGLALVDVSIGKVLVYENYGTQNDKNLVIDEINNILNIYNSSEIIISHNKYVSDDDIRFIKTELNLEGMSYIIKNQNDNDFPISYQNEVFKEIYQIKTMLSPIEELNLERMPLVSSALVSLFNFIIEHNPEIIYELEYPKILESQTKLYCGNNAIRQLNIVEENKSSSIEKIINTAKTAFGRRYVKETLLNPIKDKDEINNRYDKSIEFVNLEIEDVNFIKRTMFDIYDLERYERQINILSINHRLFYNFYTSLKNIKLILDLLQKKNFYISEKNEQQILIENNIKILNDIENIFNLEQMTIFNTASKNNKTFIKEGINQELDELVKNKDKVYCKLEEISKLIKEESKELKIEPKIKYTEKEGHYIEMTQSRYKAMKEAGYLKVFDDLKIKNLTTTIKIFSDEIKSLSDNYFVIQERITKLTLSIFKNYLKDFRYKDNVSDLISNIKLLDFFIVNYDLFNLKNCCKPEIIETDNNDKFIEINELRHLIVEEDESNGIYIPNDFLLGNSKYMLNKQTIEDLKIPDNLNGIMLHGLNASGKSTLIKSVGVAIIMAQSGFFVPAKEMRYSLFDSLFTRINGADDIHKGLSTFTIEMLEMKNIFYRAKGKTLVLGDELSHGTETQSAISIVTSGFLTLVEYDHLFIFATHLHQLKEINEINDCEKLIPLHIQVKYNKANEDFIFDRKVRYGHGLSTYGLEYAKYLNLDEKFIKKAYTIRNQINTDKSNLEILLNKKKSNYNKDLYIKQCALCSKEAVDTHHINEQKNADDFNMIGNINKNHKYNLIPLCEEHHNKVHQGKIMINGFQMTSSGLKLMFNEIEEK